MKLEIHRRRHYWVGVIAQSMTREKLAAKLGYTDTNYVNQVVTGHTPLGNANSKKWAEKLGKPADYLDQPIPEGAAAEGSLGIDEPEISVEEAIDLMSFDGKLKLMESFLNEMTLEERVEVARLALARQE